MRCNELFQQPCPLSLERDDDDEEEEDDDLY